MFVCPFWIGSNENNMKIRMWTVLLTTIRKARSNCQDVDYCRDEEHCQYHLGIDHCQTGNGYQDREHCQNGNEHANDQDQWSAQKLAMFTLLAQEYIHDVEYLQR